MHITYSYPPSPAPATPIRRCQQQRHTPELAPLPIHSYPSGLPFPFWNNNGCQFPWVPTMLGTMLRMLLLNLSLTKANELPRGSRKLRLTSSQIGKDKAGSLTKDYPTPKFLLFVLSVSLHSISKKEVLGLKTAKGRSRSEVLFPSLTLRVQNSIRWNSSCPCLVTCPQHALGKGGHRSEHLGNSGICVSLLLSNQSLTQLVLWLLSPAHQHACQPSVPFIEEHRWSPSLCPG